VAADDAAGDLVSGDGKMMNGEIPWKLLLSRF